MTAAAGSPIVLVTGANGFVGRRLCEELAREGHRLRVAVRDPARAAGLPGEVVAVGELESADWSRAVAGVDVVIHLAARVHVMRERAADPLAAFRASNVEGTERLAREAVAHQVRRLVYVSSVKVNGERTDATPFTPDDAPAPQDPYGISKHEAERMLRAIADATDLEVTVVRPPLVYGPGVGGNFLRLLRLTRRAVPLPFGAVDNRRSMIYNGNLASALGACAFHPAAAGKTYLVSDGEDLSTAALIRRLACALGVKARLVPVPRPILQLAGTVSGKAAEVDRLVGSLQVQSGGIRADLGWSPGYTVDEGLAETAAWFRGLSR
ncbi:MAG TPA: NAD-dependent epimerase/dehydratase family protein [Burkholderiales bacterium]|nr:NAD-dependent epimerase/dehydratase family protein [Burkholderiales bacterium]